MLGSKLVVVRIFISEWIKGRQTVEHVDRLGRVKKLCASSRVGKSNQTNCAPGKMALSCGCNCLSLELTNWNPTCPTRALSIYGAVHVATKATPTNRLSPGTGLLGQFSK
ncbi:Large ribosomal subunit protein [Trichinella spiralis]|uniref:Large ribosomal subunit protein n=1 Tax=Trichinella spiralis TaxID=6334 RepID=A0ABR3KUC2_TRISP